MRQRKPDSISEFIYPFWINLLVIPMGLGIFIATALASEGWERWLLWVGAVGIFVFLLWVLWIFEKTGFNQALYAHYLKRWEEKEKQEAAKLYLGRKEE